MAGPRFGDRSSIPPGSTIQAEIFLVFCCFLDQRPNRSLFSVPRTGALQWDFLRPGGIRRLGPGIHLGRPRETRLPLRVRTRCSDVGLREYSQRVESRHYG